MSTQDQSVSVEPVAYVPMRTEIDSDGYSTYLWANIRMGADEKYCDYPMIALFTAAQLKEAERRAYERAAKVCQDLSIKGGRECMYAIRKLAEEQ